MLEKEPLLFPSRIPFFYNPGVPDRQLWAIGMVIVQWGMTETLIDQQIQILIDEDAELGRQYNTIRSFRTVLDFFQSLVEKMTEPIRTKGLELIVRIRDLSSQRDEIVHHLWGGAPQQRTWSDPDNHPTTHTALLMQAGEAPKKTKSADALANIRWQLTFSGIRKIAIEIATVNRDFFQAFFVPPQEPSDHPVRPH